MFQLDWPWLLLALPLPWLVRYALPPAKQFDLGSVFVPISATMPLATAQPRPARQRVWRTLLGIIWVLLVMAATRPQWLGEAIEIPETGRSLMLALDISGSMETPDLDPQQGRRSRLDVVKEVATDFIDHREGDRIGLILFGSQAYLQTPLTFDRKTVARLLKEAVIGLAGRDTAIGDAIGLAIKRLKNVPKGKAVLILLTDGANTAGTISPRQAADLAAQAGIKIYTIGVGAKSMQVRGFFGPQLVNPSADLDEDTLRYIADKTGGRYFRATDQQTLRRIYALLDQLEPTSGGAQTVRPVSELYPWPLALAWLLSLALALKTVTLPRKQFRHGIH